MNGQLFPREREMLSRIVGDIKPRVVVECGTCTGGGSTLAIAKALGENGSGTLFTWETSKERHAEAVKGFTDEYPHLLQNKNVILECGDFLHGMRNLLCNVDIAFLDGPEDAEFTVNAFDAVSKKAKKNCTIVLHDWKAKKCVAVRQLIDASDEWRVDVELDTQTGIASVVRCLS